MGSKGTEGGSDGNGCCEGEQSRWWGAGWPSDVNWGQPISDIQEMVGDFMDTVRGVSRMESRFPATDVVETEEETLVFVDIPGLERDQFDLRVDGNSLTLSLKRERPEVEGGTSRRSERPFGAFERTLRLPTDVDTDKVSARLEGGVLTVRLPRLTAGGEGRRIEVDVQG